MSPLSAQALVGQGARTSLTLWCRCPLVPTQQSPVALQLESGNMMLQILPTRKTHQFLDGTHLRVRWELFREASPLISQDDSPHVAQQIGHIGMSQMPKLCFHFQVLPCKAYHLSIGKEAQWTPPVTQSVVLFPFGGHCQHSWRFPERCRHTTGRICSTPPLLIILTA